MLFLCYKSYVWPQYNPLSHGVITKCHLYEVNLSVSFALVNITSLAPHWFDMLPASNIFQPDLISNDCMLRTDLL